MADFSVPIATGLFTDLNDRIAAGPPKPDLSFIQNALENYKQGGDIRQQIGLRDMFQNGVPMQNGSPDFGAISKQLLQLGGAGQVQNAVGLGNYQLGRDILSGNSAPLSSPSSATAIPNNLASNEPRGLRNNNPLNIEAGGFTQSQPGYQGSDGRFAKFASLDQGVGAADNLLTSYGNRGLNTVSSIVNRWAPPGENDSRGYAASVAKALGVDPNQPLNISDPVVRQGLIRAMAQVENGRPLPQSGQPQQVAQNVPQGNPNAQPGMDQGTADRYEQAASVMFQKSQAAALINPAMSASLKAQGEAYMKQAEIIRGSIAKNAETTPEQKNANASGGMSPREFKSAEEGDKQDSAAFQKDWTGLQNAGRQAQSGIQKAQLAKNLTLDPNFYSGPLHEGVQTFNQFRAIFGSNPSSATPQEAFQKVANDMLQEQIKSMGQSGVGRVLQSEVNIMKQALASLGITPQSNRALLEIVSRVYQHNQDIADITRNVQAAPGQKSAALNQAVDQYLKAHPLFSQQELQHPQTLGAPDVPPQATKWAPQQVRQWAQGVGLKPGDPMRLNGQIVSVP